MSMSADQRQAQVRSATQKLYGLVLSGDVNANGSRKTIDDLLIQGASFVQDNENSNCIQIAMTQRTIHDRWLCISLQKWAKKAHAALAMQELLQHQYEGQWSLLHSAAQLGYPHTLNELIKQHDIISSKSSQPPQWMKRDRRKSLPLESAAFYLYSECVTLLLAAHRKFCAPDEVKQYELSALQHAFRGLEVKLNTSPQDVASLDTIILLISNLQSPVLVPLNTSILKRSLAFLAQNVGNLPSSIVELRFGASSSSLAHWLASAGGSIANASEYLEQLIVRFPAVVKFLDADDNTPLHIAVYSLDCAQIKVLISSEADVMIRNVQLQTPIDLALQLEMGPELKDAPGDMVRFFISNGPLMSQLVPKLLMPWAASKADGDLDAVGHEMWRLLMCLLKCGLSPNITSPDGSSLLSNIVSTQQLVLLGSFLSKKDYFAAWSEPLMLDTPRDRLSQSALLTACNLGRLDMARELLKHKADANVWNAINDTALHVVLRAHPDKLASKLIDLLLAHQANPLCFDEDGKLPTHLAAELGKAWALKSLLATSNALVEVRTDAKGSKQPRLTALQLAAKEGHSECVTLLLEKPYQAYCSEQDIEMFSVSDECGNLILNALSDRHHAGEATSSSALTPVGQHAPAVISRHQIQSILVHKGEKLDETNFSFLWHATYKGQKVVIKQLRQTGTPEEKERAKRSFVREMEIHALVSDAPGVLKLIGYWTDDQGDLCILLPYMAGGSLSKVLETASQPGATRLEPRLQLQILYAIACSMSYLHNITFGNPGSRFIHRDLNSRNILLDDRQQCYIADFGIAKVFDKTSRHTTAGAVKTNRDSSITLPTSLIKATRLNQFIQPTYVHRTLQFVLNKSAS